ncbi:uncharacterized protein LOC122498319 [Leptopilina heterotoma]|uniref:uncharacterized protein LOC122498319 n=1 Tax=Leptopilina heterotoma TaxID=63436 RepID=UPI001CA7D398|nr:uncharacterized protein LOC122498319 [Leptopilina heterotoma]
MDEEQVLLEWDGCYTIVNKSSIKFDPANLELKIGSSVKYLWPEEAAHKKYYTGTIIEISSSENELIKLREKKMNDMRKNPARKRKGDKSTTENEASKKPCKQVMPNYHIFQALSTKVESILILNERLSAELKEFREMLQNEDLYPEATVPAIAVDAESSRTESVLPQTMQQSTQSTSENISQSGHSNLEEDIDNNLEKIPEVENTDRVLNENEEDSLFLFTKHTAGEKATELIQGSNVYIDKTTLKDIKRRANSQTVVARLLMTSIFKEDTFLQYSLTKKGPKDKAKQALPAFAIDAILTTIRVCIV